MFYGRGRASPYPARMTVRRRGLRVDLALGLGPRTSERAGALLLGLGRRGRHGQRLLDRRDVPCAPRSTPRRDCCSWLPRVAAMAIASQ